MEDYYREFAKMMRANQEETKRIKIKQELKKHGIELKELENVPDHSPYEPF